MSEFHDMDVDSGFIIELTQRLETVHGTAHTRIRRVPFRKILCCIAHQFNGADSAAGNIAKQFLGTAGQRTKTVGNDADLYAIEFGIGFFGRSREGMQTEGGSRQCSRTTYKLAAGQ